MHLIWFVNVYLCTKPIFSITKKQIMSPSTNHANPNLYQFLFSCGTRKEDILKKVPTVFRHTMKVKGVQNNSKAIWLSVHGQNVLFCVPQKKVSHEGEQMMNINEIINVISIINHCQCLFFLKKKVWWPSSNLRGGLTSVGSRFSPFFIHL